MSTLRLWKQAIARGAQWRYLLVFVLGTLLPALVVLAPVHGFFKALFDHSTRAGELVSSLDSAAFFEVMRQLNEPDAEGIHGALFGALLVAFVLAPALAGAAAAVARVEGEGPVRLRDLLAAAGSYYPRMFRMAVVSLLPVGVAMVLAALLLKLADRADAHAVLESTASRNATLAWIGAAILVWLAQSSVEVGRAVLVAEPGRRSAFLAWWRGMRLFVRRGWQVLGVCFVTGVAAVLVAGLLTAVRLRLPVSGPVTIAIELLFAQAAVAAIGWGRASRMAGLVKVVRDRGTA
jgi:hypothetical protein